MSKKRPSNRPSNRQPSAPTASTATGRDETDLFIEEVSEELQKDRLYRQLRRYAPYAIGAILALVGTAAFLEYQKSAKLTEARAASAIFAEAEKAPEGEEAAAFLSARDQLPKGYGVLATFRAADAKLVAGDAAGAAELLDEIARTGELEPHYIQLAQLKAALARFDTADPALLIAELDPLCAEGAAYRSVALELRAVARYRAGDLEGARRDLQALLEIPGVPRNASERARQFLGLMGGALEEDTTTIEQIIPEADQFTPSAVIEDQ
ncbi:MAG: hypothetical protein MRY63_11200 [Neomegalonema sp.]|nr:hypothetical protein [Neomegalonema sp.]